MDLWLPPPEESFPKLTALARQWLDKRGPGADRFSRARVLEMKLSQSDQFQYSLQGQPRDVNLDPIEDFVQNNPRGHCEYFATALVLMLRSQGIPARIVLGYKCDEWNDLSKVYKVRQSDAHAWVEAYLAPGDIPRQLRWGNADPQRWASGAWLRLDPTPAARDHAAAGTMLAKIQDRLSWIDSLWSDYVMELDRQRQRQAIYEPLLRAVQTAAHNLFSRQWWSSLWVAAGKALHLSEWNGLAGWTLHVGLPLLVGLASSRGWGVNCGWPRGGYGGAGPAAPASGPRRTRPRVEFYRALEALLRAAGIGACPGPNAARVRPGGRFHLGKRKNEQIWRWAICRRQPPRRRVTGPDPVQVSAALDRIVAAFYRVRFGGLPLDNPEQEAVEHELAEIERWRRASRRRRFL